jgi:hypothetical protein
LEVTKDDQPKPDETEEQKEATETITSEKDDDEKRNDATQK